MKRNCFWIFILSLSFFNDIQITADQNQQTFPWIKETKQHVKHGTQCLSPSKYYAGSCYTYMKTYPAPSWERAFNNCVSLPTTNDARLLAIESIDEYHFIERDLIGLKSGSESVSVYVGLKKRNNTWFWSNDLPLKETSVYRFWVDNNRDIVDYDCGILWLARNTSVITPAPCAEQALRPYVCKQIIDRCYNNSGSCGKYGKCINLPLTNSYKCQCRFLYTGDRCEKWSSSGIQMIIGSVIIVFALILSYFTEESWRLKRSKRIDTSICVKEPCWKISSPVKSRYSFLHFKRILLLLIPIVLTILICYILFQTRKNLNYFQSKSLIRFSILYENNYYHHLLTLPIAIVISLVIIFHQTQKQFHKENQFRLFIPIPFNPFSKVNRFDIMILCGIFSHEILEILQEIFFEPIKMKSLTISGPLFDLIRQIGLIIIVSLRFYPVFSVLEMSNTNILYYILCAFYMWLDLVLRIFQQTIGRNLNNFKENHQRNLSEFEQFPFRTKTTTTTIFDQFHLDSSIVYILKSIPYYLCLTYICCRLTYLIFRKISQKCFYCRNESVQLKKHIYHEPTFSSTDLTSNEYDYVHNLFYKTSQYHRKYSFIQMILYKIYRPHRYFHYSKQILNLYMIAFMLIYSLTFNILENGLDFIEKLYHFLFLPSAVLSDEIDLPKLKSINFKYEITFACLLTSIIYSSQLVFGIKKYQHDMLNAYQGIYEHIPSRLIFRDARLMTKNIHYPGYCIAYLTLGYFLIGSILFLVFVVLRLLFNHLFLLEEFAKLIIPILSFYLIKYLVQWFLSRTFFLQKHGQTMVLRNLRMYFLFIYFNFFFDCILGIISCLFRIMKSWLITFLYLPRLDYSPFGRSLEKFDSAFVSYVSFIHMECLHTHPVLIYFCSIIDKQLNKRNQYLRQSKREIFSYTYHRRIIFRWWLAITLDRNRQLISWRKHRLLNRNFRENTFSIIQNHTITCTTLLLDVDDRNSSF